MISTSIAWLFLPSRLGVTKDKSKGTLKVENGGHGEVKREDEDDLNDYLSSEDMMESQQTFLEDSKAEEEQAMKEEEEPDPMHGEEGNTEVDITNSGIGTSLDTRSFRGIQRRRIHPFTDHNQGG
jgi:hypothetical protein